LFNQGEKLNSEAILLWVVQRLQLEIF